MEQVDFGSLVSQYISKYDKIIHYNNSNIGINFIDYSHQKIIEVIKEWKTLLSLIGKQNLFIKKNIVHVIYSILSDLPIIEKINNHATDLHFYDHIMNRFLRIDYVTETNRYFKIKIFNVCNTLTLFDFNHSNKYKIYEIYNLNQIKEYYGSKKINFDQLAQDLALEPIYSSNIVNLNEDRHKLSIENKNNILDKSFIIKTYTKFIKKNNQLEKKIQKWHQEFIKLKKIDSFIDC
jgi:hypothetical protein